MVFSVLKVELCEMCIYQVECGINADDIAQALLKGAFKLSRFHITSTRLEFEKIAEESGLINKKYPSKTFKKSFTFGKNSIQLKKKLPMKRSLKSLQISFEKNS